MPFQPADFSKDPDLDDFDGLNKESLVALGRHLNLEVKKAMRKHEIQCTIVKHLVETGVFEESALICYTVKPSDEIRKTLLQAQLEMHKLYLKK